MSSDPFIFRRPELARSMADQMLNPGLLGPLTKSGIFLSGPRRVGKTTFLKFDFIPELEARGALVLYVDLWSQPNADPGALVNDAVRKLLAELEAAQSPLLSRLKALKRLSHADLGAYGLRFGFKLEQVGLPNGVPLAQVFTELVDKARTDVVLIIDEVQHALGSPAGGDLLIALKAAREAVNLRPDTPGRLFMIGTGSHRAQLQEMVVRNNQAFQGAHTETFPVLGQDYVQALLDHVRPQLLARTPALAVAGQAFELLGYRPEELLKALGTLMQSSSPLSPDAQLPVIAQALRVSAADLELSRLEHLGDLPMAIFDRICDTRNGEATKGLYGGKALDTYSAALGRPVKASDVQMALKTMSDANLIMARGAGRYQATDPFVRQVWLSNRQLAQTVLDASPQP